MFTINFGRSQRRFCDAIPRRSFLRIGGLAVGGLTLPSLLRAEASAGAGNSNKSIIMVYLPGGPPHQDMWDLKLDAPDVRPKSAAPSTGSPRPRTVRAGGHVRRVRPHSLAETCYFA